MITKDPKNEEHFDNTIDAFEDVIDCSIIGDDDMQAALDQLEHDPNSTVVDEDLDMDRSDIFDYTVDFSDDIVSANFIDMDTDDMIASERDMIYDPFEDDDIIDSIAGNDADMLDTCSVKWEANTKLIEIPNAIPLSVTISPEEVKDLAALHQKMMINYK